jgi:putative ABC transport system permease protein
MSAGRPASRAVVRWSLRLFRREWRQQVLILALLTVAVGAAVWFATAAVNGSSAVVEPFGGADTRITIDGHDPDAADRALTEARARFGTVDVTAHQSVAVPGSVRHLDVRDQDPEGAYSAKILDLRAGRYPDEPGEVALTDDAADLLGADLHSEVSLGGEQVRVVGLVENPANFDDDFVLVAPGGLTAPDALTLLVDSAHQREPQDGDIGFQMEVLGSDTGQAGIAAIVLAVTTLALALVGLLAMAAFVVIAQRRQRQLGMLVAIGATQRHVRLVMLATGAITGAAATAVGLVLGVVAWLLSAPTIERAAGHRIPHADLPWPLIVAVAVLAVVAATVAAWWPARMTARLPVMAALAGRPAAPRPVHRSLLVAVALVAAGVAAIAVANPLSRHVRPVLFVAGLVAVVIGTVFATPAAVRVGGRLAHRLPLAPRVALRDLARYQARAAAALGAITLGLAVSVGIVAIAAANEPDPAAGDLSDHELLVLSADTSGEGDAAPSPDQTAAEVATLDQRAADVIAAVGGDTDTAPLDYAVSPRPTPDASRREPVAIGVATSPHSIEGRGRPYVATPEMLALYDIDPESIESGTELLTSRRAPFILLDFTAKPGFDVQPAEAQHVDLPTYGSAPNALVTEAAMVANDWVPVRVGWVVESASPLTGDQIQAARRAAADAGLEVQTRETHDELAALRTGATVAGVVLAVAIVTIAVGLIRSEARRDMRTLTATGARQRTRRALTASTAAGLALPGVLLGLGGAYLALVASYHADLGRLVPIPFGQLLPLALGTPLAAFAVGWLLAGREPRTFARQELE